MKRFFKWTIGTAMLTIAFLAVLPAQKVYAQDDYVSYQTFYDDLSPYGQWVYDPEYGNVWVPEVDNDFRPYYSGGHWSATNYGNMWVSDYPWGWAAFHYGRWTFDPYYGWVWIPGTEWGPAWVNWRNGGGYYGWAPLGPGISFSASFNNYSCPNDWWVFVGPQYLYRNDFHRHWRGTGYNQTIIYQTTIINNNYNNRYVYGPRYNEIQSATHQRINVYNVNTMHRPGRPQVSGNTVNVFRPEVRWSATAAPANLYRAPRAINTRPQSVVNGRPEFRTAVQNRQLQPMSTRQAPANNNRLNNSQPNPAIRQQNVTRPQPIAPQQQVRSEQRFDQRQQQQPVRQEQRFDQRQQQQPVRQEPMRQEPRIERQQQQPMRQEPIRQEPMRQERQEPMQRQRNQPMTMPQPQRIENNRPQAQPQMQPQQQRMESRPQMQRVERQQPMQQQQQQPQRVERQQPVMRQEPQRVQPAPRQEPQRAQPQTQPRPQGGREGGRR